MTHFNWLLDAGEPVEVFHDDAWWQAAFVKRSPGGTYLIRYIAEWGTAKQDDEAEAEAIRPLWEFQRDKDEWTLNDERWDVSGESSGIMDF